MFSSEERLASFAIASSSTSSSAAKKRQSTKSSSALQWPHPVTGRSAKTSGIPTPSTLAEHGFYHTPSQDEPDAVSHFLYPEVQIANWQASDDPLVRLEVALPGNGWCRIFRSQQAASLDEASGTWTWQVAELLPTSKEMVQARKETFGSQWPYDGKKGWKPTSKKLAEAGFYFIPSDQEPDNAKCIYCSKSLDGWEKADDPVHEHQRRVPDCAFFNCELRKPINEPALAEAADTAHTDQEVVAIEAPKKGGKRAVSTSRKASAKVAKGKKSVAALAKKQEEEEDEAPADQQDEPEAIDVRMTRQEELESGADKDLAPPKKGSRKARSVSTRKLAAKAQAQEEEEPNERESAVEVEDEPPVEAPAQVLSKKKSATGLGNGIASQSTAARPARAASRRATKAINLLSDEGLNRKLRRPDEEDLAKRELALSDPIPFPTAASEDQSVPATDPIQPSKPTKSRSRSKKLDQETTVAASKAPSPEPEAATLMDEDPAPVAADDTIIEHNNDDGDEELAEEPKRRGGRATKTTSTKVSAGKASTSGTKSRKASTEETVMVADKEDETTGFPSMSSEADPEPAHKSSSIPASKLLAPAKGRSSQEGSSTGSRKPSASSSSKRGSAKSTPLVSEINVEPVSTDGLAMLAESESDGLLPNTGSQATIRGAPRSSSIAVVPSSTDRSPLSHLPQLTQLDLNDSERAMTLGEWLQAKAEAAAVEMRAEGEAQLADLENQFRAGRVNVERRLRGRA